MVRKHVRCIYNQRMRTYKSADGRKHVRCIYNQRMRTYKCAETPRPAQLDITPNTIVPPGANLPRREWVSLNRIRTGVGRFNAAMHRWGLRPSAACQCGAPEQTAQHILSECPDLRPPDNVDLTHPTPGTVTWLEHLRDVT